MRGDLIAPDQGADFWVRWIKRGKRDQIALNGCARFLRETHHLIARLTGLGRICGRGEAPHLAPDDLEDRGDTDAEPLSQHAHVGVMRPVAICAAYLVRVLSGQLWFVFQASNARRGIAWMSYTALRLGDAVAGLRMMTSTGPTRSARRGAGLASRVSLGGIRGLGHHLSQRSGCRTGLWSFLPVAQYSRPSGWRIAVDDDFSAISGGYGGCCEPGFTGSNKAVPT